MIKIFAQLKNIINAATRFLKDLAGLFITLFSTRFKRVCCCNKQENALKEEELTKYINKIFEQQEKERVVRWLVNSIRESLELDTVLNTTVKKVSRLLKVDRCLIALFNNENKKFNFKNEFRNNTELLFEFEAENSVCNLPDVWYNSLVRSFCPVIINECHKEPLCVEQSMYYDHNDIKSLIIVPIVDENEILGIIIAHQVNEGRIWEDEHVEILTDIGNQIAIAIKQATLYAKVQETTRLKSEFLSGMSHELRTPLNAIIGFSEMLDSEDYGKLSEKQKKFVNNIKVSGEHLLRLVNDILDLSKIEAGKMDINCEVFNVHKAVQEILSILNGLADKKNIAIFAEINPDALIHADLIRFKQIMYNLLSNAIKFTGEGGKIDVRTRLQNANVIIEIEDNGIGIALKDRDKIFKNFRQLDSSLTRKQEGTGLGLILTKKLIELHKGFIDFESEEGKGSKFWFSLPCKVSQKI